MVRRSNLDKLLIGLNEWWEGARSLFDIMFSFTIREWNAKDKELLGGGGGRGRKSVVSNGEDSGKFCDMGWMDGRMGGDGVEGGLDGKKF